ncbi:glycosyltransferase [Agaribacterium sp. ZY112]|uniref:glycosyltransferase n=1 Tax=Agaribacterium sp. ZY112 TaxID=3233574 RepID=UPI0035232941
MHRVSVCMIVRDAEEVLERCIDSLAGGYDELCIVDTGSTDNTADIARRRADIFERYTGCNNTDQKIIDFSDARNRCVRLAQGDWILSIDADEVFSNKSDKTIKQLLEVENKTTAAAITISRGQTQWLAIRLFRNMAEQRFHHAVHEVVNVTGEVITLRDLCIQDLGQSQKTEESASRNARICRNLLNQNPADLRAMFYLAEALRKQGKFIEAGDAYMDCLDHPQLSTAYRCATLESLATCFLYLKKWQEAIDCAQMVVDLHSGLAEAYCLMGDANLALRNVSEAKACYLKAKEQKFPPDNYSLFVRKGSYGEYPQQQLSALELLCKKHDIEYEVV